MYNVILFDLDGTLTDSGIGITNSVKYSLRKFGIDMTDSEQQLNKFIGPPLHESFQMFCGFTKEESAKAVKYYREYYKETGLFENTVYEGIEELLVKLKESGRKIIVATSKPELFARQILDHFGLAKYFTYIAGANMDETRTNKLEVIAYALESCGIEDLSNVIMIGDREYDIFGAKAIGVDSIGVLYGYGSLEELTNANATYIAEKVEDIYEIIEQSDKNESI